MLAEGNDRFDRIERELKETNGLLRELVGMFKASRLHSEDACWSLSATLTRKRPSWAVFFSAAPAYASRSRTAPRPSHAASTT